MTFFKFIHKKKYIEPFIDNLNNQFEMNNAVFLSESKNQNFLIILCIQNKIFEIQKINEKIIFFNLELNKNNFEKWQDYKDKIIKMKNLAISSSSKDIILIIAENVREIVNQTNLSFEQTKNILKFLININQAFFINNTINIDENMENLWID